jgi:hypothetical protein
MAGIPDTIVVARDRDLVGRRNDIWLRRALFGLVCAVPVLALLNVFGQRPERTNAASAAAVLSVYAPARVRSGLLYQARFHIRARRDVRKAILVLDPGWLEGMTVNTIEPSPISQASADGKLTLELGHVPAGKSYLLYMQFQVNPTNVGHRHQTVALYDGPRKLLEVHRTITVFP